MAAENNAQTSICPRPVRILAAFFMFQGVLSVVRCVSCLLCGNLYIDLGFLSIPAAFLLLEGDRGARGYAKTVLVLGTLGCVVVMGFLLYRLLMDDMSSDLHVFGPWAVRAPLIAGLGLNIVVLFLFLWFLRLLASEEVRSFFEDTPKDLPGGATRGLRIAAYAAIAVSLAFPAAAVCHRHLLQRFDEGRSIVRGAGRISFRSYGYRYGRLAYVVFAEAEKSLNSPVSTDHRRSVKLSVPGGRRIELPNRVQLYEIIDGKFRQDETRVTRPEFEAFLALKPERYGIDALLDFVRGRRH